MWLTTLVAVALTGALALCVAVSEVSANPGDLDPTFGTGGKVTTAIGGDKDFAWAVAIQADGRIVAAGETWNGADLDFGLVRYNEDGTLDGTFGTGGKVTTDVGGGYATAVAIQADGRIVAAGLIDNGVDWDFGLVRYNTDGTLDGTFGTGGKVTTDIGGSYEYAWAVAIQADGRIVAAGDAYNGANYDFALVRYNVDGTLDGTFGMGGKVITDLGGYDQAYGVAIQADGQIVAAGRTDADFALVRYNANGTLDGTFGTGGKVITDFFSHSEEMGLAMAMQANGQIIVAGESGWKFALARYNADGALDGAFGMGGKVTTDIGGSSGWATAVAIQADGRIVAAGYTLGGSNDNFALVRYNADGTLDGTFGTGGNVTTDFGAKDRAFDVAIQASGQIVVVGTKSSVPNSVSGDDFALARYVATAACGNSVTDPGESCDDGNTVDGDGCSATCTTEPGWTCAGQPSVCTTCGNGIVDPGEQCDDGNTVGGDCCSPACQYDAPTTPCADDGNLCTDDQCDASGTCTHNITAGCPDHYMCDKAAVNVRAGGTKFDKPNFPARSLQDQFGTETCQFKKEELICAPAEKNNEGPPANPTIHQVSYLLKCPMSLVPITGVTVLDQFNPTGVAVTLTKKFNVLVPSGKTDLGPIPPGPPQTPPSTPPALTVDHFLCYKVRGPSYGRAPIPVTVTDQFYPSGYPGLALYKMTKLCTPVNKQDEDPTAPTHIVHLACYQAKLSGGAVFNRTYVSTNNTNFGANVLKVTKTGELCVPALKNP
jgi:uncharacterized delta-60 repeat protein